MKLAMSFTLGGFFFCNENKIKSLFVMFIQIRSRLKFDILS